MTNIKTKNDNITVLKGKMHMQIQAYLEGRIKFPTLVNEIDIIVQQFRENYKNIVESLQSDWRTLEEINALALDEGKLSPLDEHVNLVEQVLNELTINIDRHF